MVELSQHTEWLSLVEMFGPFLTVPVLEAAFPQGLDAVRTPHRQRLRRAYDEWTEAVDEKDPELNALHREWVRLVLTEILEYDDRIMIPRDRENGGFSYTSPDNSGTFFPDWTIRNDNGDPRMFISVQAPGTDLETVQLGDGWPVSLTERMTLLCRANGVRIGLVTNGERWMLVNAPVGSTSGHTSWYARLWFQEPVTLKAFQSLLGVRRCFGPPEENLDTLLEESLKYRQELTDTLGEQVRRAVEVLVQCLDKADQDRNRELLRDVSPSELYEAGLTLMMRLVFVLCAEERGLLLSDDPVYDQYYAVSTLRGQLTEEADRHGPEVLDRRHDAWARLLAVFRAIYGGIEHESLRMPALGGSLFDPDRFPFLEGRSKGSHWRTSAAAPIPIDNRTVLMLMDALQVLEQKGGALLLSYKTLDVEQIGHVYEGLLEHTVARVPAITLGLIGSGKAKNPNVRLAELESARDNGTEALTDMLKEVTQRSASAVKNSLERPTDDASFGKLLTVCGGDTGLANRIRPFFNLLRTDAWKDPIVYRADSFMVTLGADRRETGTHYTPKSLTENIVSVTLEPLVYRGPAEGKTREQWELKRSAELLELKVCDPAMGSGAFLVETCRYLAEKLVESWNAEEGRGMAITAEGEARDGLGSADPMPTSLDERMIIARRLVAERCLYGVDVNPLAVELAKLSVWLVTMAKGRPFGFLEHNLRSGDSLLGIHRLDQLTNLEMNPEAKNRQMRLFGQSVETAVREAVDLRQKLRAMPIRDIRDIETMARLHIEAREKLEAAELIADAMIGEALKCSNNASKLDSCLSGLAASAEEFLHGDSETARTIAIQSERTLSTDLPDGKPRRNPFHWALEFPEVFSRENPGFDAIVGNPPYMGGQKITGNFGDCYRDYIIENISSGKKGSADLCAYFVVRANRLIRNGGLESFILSSSICEGDTREIGLQSLLASGSFIIRASGKSVWPGKASVTFSPVWIYKGDWKGEFILDGKIVSKINSYLSEAGEGETPPKKLQANSRLSFQGSIPLGQGFVLDSEKAQFLINKGERNRDVIFPYLVGKELNIHSRHEASQWIINFQNWPLDRSSAPKDYEGPVAADYPDCLEIVMCLVKPEREKSKRKTRRDRWWQYAERATGLYEAIKGLKWVPAIATQATKYVAFGLTRGAKVFSNAIAIIACDDFAMAGLLSSSIHEIWARKYGGHNLLLLRYSPSDLFETFPLPDFTPALRQSGQEYFEYRERIMIERNEGLTKIYNRFHDSNETSPDVEELRKRHVFLDKAVVEAYGWANVELSHGFHETKQGVRFTVSEAARTDLLRRLLTLNHKRYEEEAQQGLHGKKSREVSADEEDDPTSFAMS